MRLQRKYPIVKNRRRSVQAANNNSTQTGIVTALSTLKTTIPPAAASAGRFWMALRDPLRAIRDILNIHAYAFVALAMF
jgi:hypothetical protein